jgi:hypothetical protein
MTAETFADYAAAAEERGQIAHTVLSHTLSLCEALKQNYINYSIRSHQLSLESKDDDYGYHDACIKKLRQGICDYDYTVETGRKYHKIIMNANGNRSVHAFVDKKTGEVYKSASWKAPAKGVRYNLLDETQREWLFQYADWAGSYLYRN